MATYFEAFLACEAFAIFKVGQKYFVNLLGIDGIIAKVGLVRNPALFLLFYRGEVAFDEAVGIGPRKADNGQSAHTLGR